jgi:hypothetical protein
MLGLGLDLTKSALSSEGLALDLQFAADKTLTARKGPTPTFSRASGATQVNASGLIEYAPENILLRSQDQSNTSVWLELNSATRVANSSIGLDGTMSATKIIFSSASGSLIYQGVNLGSTINTPLTISVWVSSASAKKFRLGVFGSSQFYSSVLTSTSTLTRYSFTVENVNASGINAVIANDSAGGVGEITVWGFQLERYSSARAYIPTTTAAVYGARFDHDPVTLASRGLLIEEARTNLLLRSDDFNDAVWNPGISRNLSVTVNNTTSPSGATDADLLTVGATTTTYQVLQGGPTLTSGAAYTFSCYLKANQVTRVSLYSGNSATYPVDAYFDLTGNGSVTANALGTASIQKLANGWYRCVVTGTAGATAATSIRISPATTGNSRTYVGNSTDSFWAWGAQLEAGSFLTSYIPTTTASVVRSADVCSITGSNFSGFYNQSEGAAFVDFSLVSGFSITGRAMPLFWVSNNTFNETVRIGSATSSLFPVIDSTVGGSLTRATSSTAASLSSRNKTAGAYKAGGIGISTNGSVAVVASLASITNLANRLDIGGYHPASGLSPLCGHIAAVRYFEKRLTDAKLQSLTA